MPWPVNSGKRSNSLTHSFGLGGALSEALESSEMKISKQQIQMLRGRAKKTAETARISKLSDLELTAEIRCSSDRFLVSVEWRDLRLKVLEKYGRICMCCKRIPRNKASINVDHIKARKYFPELSLVFENLQVLCDKCNKRKGNKHFTDYRPLA